MAVRGTSISRDFDKYKKQGLSDSEAMEKALSGHSKATVKERKSNDKKKKKMGVITRAAKGLKSVFGPGHSKAGRRYLAGKVKKYGK